MGCHRQDWNSSQLLCPAPRGPADPWAPTVAQPLPPPWPPLSQFSPSRSRGCASALGPRWARAGWKCSCTVSGGQSATTGGTSSPLASCVVSSASALLERPSLGPSWAKVSEEAWEGWEGLEVPLLHPLVALGCQGPGQKTSPSGEGKPPRGSYRHEASHSISLPVSVGLGSIHLSEVRCRGYERTLGECPALEGSQNGCRHENDAAVRCNVPNVGFQNQVSSGLDMT